MAEKNIPKEKVNEILGDRAVALDNIRLCDLNDDNRKIYEDAVKEV